MDGSNLTWREKLAMLDTSARVAATMFLAIAAACEAFMAVWH
jgi:hypothetical protein